MSKERSEEPDKLDAAEFDSEESKWMKEYEDMLSEECICTKEELLKYDCTCDIFWF